MARAWPILRNALLAGSLAFNGYFLYTVHEARQLRNSAGMGYALAAAEQAGRIYARIERDPALRDDIAGLAAALKGLAEHQEEFKKEVAQAYRPLRPLIAPGRARQPPGRTP